MSLKTKIKEGLYIDLYAESYTDSLYDKKKHEQSTLIRIPHREREKELIIWPQQATEAEKAAHWSSE
jgi:hypothetical protein